MQIKHLKFHKDGSGHKFIEVECGTLKDLVKDISEAAKLAHKNQNKHFRVFYTGTGQRPDEKGQGGGDWRS